MDQTEIEDEPDFTIEDHPVRVETTRGTIPFSVGYLAQDFMSIGLTQEDANYHASQIFNRIMLSDRKVFGSEEVMNVAISYFYDVVRDPKLAYRLKLVTNDLEDLRPLIILFGGVTGVGKSTMAQMVGSRMGIKSVLGTDLIRELLRITLNSDLMPTLHSSSYAAYEHLNTSFLPSLADSITGFEEQARTVLVGIEAAIEQSIIDDEIVIIEGVHLVPGLIREQIVNHESVIYIQLVVPDEETHLSRLKRRENKEMRRGTAYISHFAQIREIQHFMNAQAREFNISTIDVSDLEKSIFTVMNMIWDKIYRRAIRRANSGKQKNN